MSLHFSVPSSHSVGDDLQVEDLSRAEIQSASNPAGSWLPSASDFRQSSTVLANEPLCNLYRSGESFLSHLVSLGIREQICYIRAFLLLLSSREFDSTHLESHFA